MNTNYFQHIVFPVIFYDITYKYPPYKVLENRVLNFFAFKDFEDLIAESYETMQIRTLFRMIDGEGKHYSKNFSRDAEFNVPYEVIGSLSVDELKLIMEPWIKRLPPTEKVTLNNCFETKALIDEIIRIGNESEY